MAVFGGVILAGGKSSRMGQEKGIIPVNGLPMIEHMIKLLESVGIKDPIIISNHPDHYKKFNCKVYGDLICDRGPLGGIHSGLHNSDHMDNIILSCDMPFLDRRVLIELMNTCASPVTVTKFQERLNPLVGIYSKELLDSIQISLDNLDLKLEHLIAKHEGKIIDLDYLKGEINEHCFANINSQNDLKYYAG